MSQMPNEFQGVTLVAKGNVYFDGKVVSHAFHLADGTRKTVGFLFPGKFHFGTDSAERMEITAGECRVQMDGQPSIATYGVGQRFKVAAKSGFDIEVAGGLCQYICTYLG